MESKMVALTQKRALTQAKYGRIDVSESAQLWRDRDEHPTWKKSALAAKFRSVTSCCPLR